mmetsp:Transcript_64590/g.154333  ORF Transcript_64590/g.154333 Transcript_64590/m.154333 type:complete len:177 (+) Transcript_64590:139-669(+)
MGQVCCVDADSQREAKVSVLPSKHVLHHLDEDSMNMKHDCFCDTDNKGCAPIPDTPGPFVRSKTLREDVNAGIEEVLMTIDKRLVQKAKLGMDVETSAPGSSLLVRRIWPGYAVHVFNELVTMQGQKGLEEGSRIVSVNGVVNDVEEMLNLFRDEKVTQLRLKVCQSTRSRWVEDV